MVGRRPRRPARSRTALSGSHAKSWLFGRHAVVEALTAGRWLPIEAAISADIPATLVAEFRKLAESRGVPMTVETPARLMQWTGSREHQGYVARMPEFPYLHSSDFPEDWHPQRTESATEGPAALYLLLDRIQDPYNFGAMLRSAEVLGVDAVFVGSKSQSAVTPHVARSSAGAVHHVPLVQVESLSLLVDDWNRVGLQTIGTTGGGTVEIGDCDLSVPTALILGNEGTGVSDELLSRCRVTTKIPQLGTIESLNAAVATGIVLYEALRQRRPRK